MTIATPNPSSAGRFTSVSDKRSDRRARRRGPAAGRSVGAIIWAVFFLTCSVATTQSLDRVLAVVSGQVILASDVRAFLELGLFTVDTSDPEARESVALSLLIDRRLALDEVERYGPVQPSAARVDENLAAVRARFADEAAFTRLLAAVGLDQDDLRQILSDNARLEAYLADRFGTSIRLAGPRPAPVADWLAGLARRTDIARFDQ